MITRPFSDYNMLLADQLDVSGSEELSVYDHLNDFDSNGNNKILHKLNSISNNRIVRTQYTLPDSVRILYPNLKLCYYHHTQLLTARLFEVFDLSTIKQYNKTFDNFICSFNGSDSVSRQFLISALCKFDWFNKEFSSKNFAYSINRLDGNISHFFTNPEQEKFYRKFIIDESLTEFYNSQHGFDYTQFNHNRNMNILVNKISSSCIQIVGETAGTFRFPFITEKFLYPVIAKTIWISYGQQGWHRQITELLGFRLYDKIFDYKFDDIENPVVRLIEMLSMLAKFEKLTKLDWHDLYLLEQDTIEYNYDHYFSKQYLTSIKNFNDKLQ